MLKRFVCMFPVIAAMLGSACCVTHVTAKDYFLTIGGGSEVTSNQLSLERNVIFQQSVLEKRRPDHPDFEIWFADGNDASRDVQCRDPKFDKTCPPSRRLLAEILGDADSMELVYRNNEIKGLKGPSDLKQVKERFRTLASDVKSGDRVIIYATGHGGRSRRSDRGRRRSGSNPYNTTLYFWNSETVSSSEFSDWLDRFPPDVQVVLIMVQCYAGGFSHTIFQHADVKAGLSPHERCGFFAQMHDRAAAGCTPDADEADFEEYSSCFWTALAGQSRDGKTLDSADYDKNGQVSFAEAHAYAMIESDTIDVPVRTSGALLHQYSRIGRLTEEASDSDNQSDNPPSKGDADSKEAEAEFTKMNGPISKLLTTCRPEQRAILERLPDKCELGAEPTIEGIQQKLQQKKETLDTLNAKLSTAARTLRNELKQLKEEMFKQWPELRGEYTPLAFELADERGPEFVRSVEAMPNYKSWRDAKSQERECAKAVIKAERASARLERLQRTCEDVVLAENISRIASPEIVKRYQQLLAMEDGTLADSGKTAISNGNTQR